MIGKGGHRITLENPMESMYSTQQNIETKSYETKSLIYKPEKGSAIQNYAV
jgi:hypothetical protein